MGSGFNNATHNSNGTAASLDTVRGQAMKRLAGVQQSLESSGVGSAFIRAAKADPIGDMGFMGGLILGLLISGPLAAFTGPGLSGVFNSVSAGLEGVAAVSDQKAYAYRSRQLSDYPEGRRRCALEAARMSKKFNLVSATQSHHFSYNVQADLACMFEILDILDQLEKEGVSMIRLDPKESVYGVLKQVSRQMSKNVPVRNYAAPMLKVA